MSKPKWHGVDSGSGKDAPDSARVRNANGGSSASGRRNRRSWKAPVIIGAATALVAVTVMYIAQSRSRSQNASTPATSQPAPGQQAPNGTFQVASSSSDVTSSISSLRGHPVVLWFVTTWCSSCQAGTQAMAQNMSKLSKDGVHVVEVELAKDLGQPGPSISQMVKQASGVTNTGNSWTIGVASPSLTLAYDSAAYLDIYYLINSSGKITYINSSPGSTMPQLLNAAASLA